MAPETLSRGPFPRPCDQIRDQSGVGTSLQLSVGVLVLLSHRPPAAPKPMDATSYVNWLPVSTSYC
jgi:hypothetical protein